MALTFRVAHTPISNTIFSGKPLTEVDVSLFVYGKPMENTIFKTKDQNGDMTLLEAWRRECFQLNKRYPSIHHWVDTEQPDSEGAYYRGLPGEQWRNEMKIALSFAETENQAFAMWEWPHNAAPVSQNDSPGTSLWDKAIETIANAEFITVESIETVQRPFVDAITSEDPTIRGYGMALMQTALGKAAERIVVLESLLESERKLRQADRAFALKNATYL